MRRRVSAVGIRAALLVAVACACLAGAAGTWQTSGDPDGLEIREISVRRVAVGEGDPAQDLEYVDAIVGDLLHVRAAVRNGTVTTTYEQLRVDFYFTEVVTKEHGLLGSQTVYSLSPGEERLPAISVPTAGFTPGFYVFTAAIADPMSAEQTAEGTQYIVSYTQPETSDFWKVVADQGPRIAELQDLLDPFPSCQYGGVQNAFSLNVRNVGTASLGLLDVVVEVRPKFGDAIEDPLVARVFPSGLATPGNFEGRLIVDQINTDPLEATLKPLPERLAHFEVLGRGNTTERLQLVVTVTPTSGDLVGPQQKVTLPSQEEGAIVFSERDKWQYPQPAGCVCGSSDEGTCNDVPTTSPAIRPVGYSSELLFHIAVSEATGEYRVHALDPQTGESRDRHLLGAMPLTDPVIRFRQGAEPLLFEYHAYVGTGAGTVEVYTLLVDKREGSANYEWSAGIGDTSGTSWQPRAGVVGTAATAVPETFLQLADVSSGAEGETVKGLIVAGPQGIVVLNAETGALLQTITVDGVKYAPAVANGFVWYSIDQRLYGVELDATGSGAPDACSLEFSRAISTPLEPHAGLLYWGDGQGNLHVLDVSGGCAVNIDADWTMESIAELGPVVGLSVGVDGQGNGDDDPVVFASDVDGVVASIEYKSGNGQFDRGTKRTSQGVQLDGRDDNGDGTVLSPARNGTTSRPVILPETAPESVFLVAKFDADSDTAGKSGVRWALVAWNPGTNPFEVRKFTNWGVEDVQFVLKLDGGVGPMLEPVLIGDSLLVVAVPGERLYALDVTAIR